MTTTPHQFIVMIMMMMMMIMMMMMMMMMMMTTMMTSLFDTNIRSHTDEADDKTWTGGRGPSGTLTAGGRRRRCWGRCR
jgi:uncharacterized membrane protein